MGFLRNAKEKWERIWMPQVPPQQTQGNPILNWKEINNTKPSGFGITQFLQ